MKILKKIGKWLLIILVLINLAIIISGRTYIYKGLGNTYLKGRSGPGVDEYDIFDNRTVEAGTHQPWEKAEGYNSKQIPESQTGNFETMQTIAFVVIKDGALLHEQYWDGFNADSKINSFSMAKTFVGILIGAAIEEGKIKSLDQPAGDFLPEFKEGDNSKLTIRHLLTMSSGINFDEDYVSPLAYPAQAFYGSDLQKLTFGYKVTEEPGKVFKYLSGNTELLGFILEKATGKKLSEYASEKLWKPLGAKNDALWSLDHENGMEKAYCCFNSNAPDFARFGQLYLDSGKWNGQQLIPANFVEESVNPAPLLDINGKPNELYGYAWWLIPDYKGHKIFYARGILGQYIICIPDEKMVIVRMGRKREKRAGNEHPLDMFYYMDAALEMYGGK
ncbi:MAG: beta-lactamase family protein [Bacteroidota bacterium]|nr:beta-lactamase family protein [Bacteroidota bacterium]